MRISAKTVEIEVRNIDLSEVCDLYEDEKGTVFETLEEGQLVSFVTTSNGLTSLIVQGKSGEATEIRITKVDEIKQ